MGANRVTPQTRRRIAPLGHDTYQRYAPWTSGRPAWSGTPPDVTPIWNQSSRVCVMSARARTFDYAVEVDEAWDARSERGGAVLAGDDEEHWAPEHLVLAGLARCSLTSLRYHCTRAGVGLSSRASARGTVTRREDDGRFAFVEIT